MSTHNIKKQLSAAYRYSYTRLALNLYGYFEVCADGGSTLPQLSEFEHRFFHLLSDFLEKKGEEEDISQLRNEISECMESLLSYADCFQIYEYVFNRLEKRFVSVKSSTPSQEELLYRIKSFFTSAEDSMVMNSRIQAMIGEVPVRFTKNKFFSIVRESLGTYAGGSRKSLDSLFERLCIFERLQNPVSSCKWEQDFAGVLERLSDLDYKNLTPEIYSDSVGKLKETAVLLTDWTERLHLLQELVNDLYVLLLSKDQAMIELGDETVVSGIVSGLLTLFSSGKLKIPEEITHRLILLEGKQELYYEKYFAFSEEISTDAILSKVDKLLSGSAFISLDMETGEDGIVDELWLNKKADQFFEMFSNALEGKPKMVVRAVMAQLLSSIPLWFRSVDEIMAYISEGLDACTDIYEKETSMELMDEFMEMEYAFV